MAVDRQTAQNARLTRPDLTPFCVSAQEAELLLERTAAGLDELGGPPPAGAVLADGNVAAERALRRAAAAAGAALPLDDLARRFRLDRTEQDALLLALAPELDRGWERAYAYVVDDLNRRLPSMELIVTVLRPAGRTDGGPPAARPGRDPCAATACSAAGAAVAIGRDPGVRGRAGRFPEFLLGAGGAVDLLGDDPGEVLPPPGYAPPPQLPAGDLAAGSVPR